MYTDVSKSGWGAQGGITSIGGQWSDDEIH